MKLRVSPSLLFAIAFILTFMFAQSASAHAGQPRIEISTNRMNPGGVVDIRGVGFDYEESGTLKLIGSQAEILLEDITANTQGEFTYIARLPTDLVEGTYYFRAVTGHHFVLSPPITVWGTAIQEEGGHGYGEREEEDPLLAPMPTFAPGVVPGGVVPTKVETVAASAPASSQNWILPAIGALIVIGISILLGLRRKNQS